MLFPEDGVFIAAVFAVCISVMDGSASQAAKTVNTAFFDPHRLSIDQFYGMCRASLLTGVASHTLVIHPEFLCFSALYIERIKQGCSCFFLLT